jgi:hypothetical protein
MMRLTTGQDAATRGAAEGIGISELERRAMDDVAFRAGCSLAEAYVCCEPCWRGWVCARVMEHLRGECFWWELDLGDFGLLKRRWHANLELVESVVARIATGADTLHVLVWAVETQHPLEAVVTILRTLRMDARHLPRFPWLSPAAPCGRA